MADILIVDDTSFMRNVLKKIVLRSGHTVAGEAVDGDEAIELYQHACAWNTHKNSYRSYNIARARTYIT